MNALRIMSIHKSKGLQFPIVIIPLPTGHFPQGERMDLATTDEPPFDQIGKAASIPERNFWVPRMKPRTGKRSNSNSSTTPTLFMSPSPEPNTNCTYSFRKIPAAN